MEYANLEVVFDAGGKRLLAIRKNSAMDLT